MEVGPVFKFTPCPSHSAFPQMHGSLSVILSVTDIKKRRSWQTAAPREQHYSGVCPLPRTRCLRGCRPSPPGVRLGTRISFYPVTLLWRHVYGLCKRNTQKKQNLLFKLSRVKTQLKKYMPKIHNSTPNCSQPGKKVLCWGDFFYFLKKKNWQG